MPDGTPLIPLIRCDRRALSLTKSACAASWTAAERKRPDPWQGSWHCRGCPLGAANAGKGEGEALACAAAAALRNICPRCTRPAGRLIQSRLCVSCYNREREAIKGRNAKGGVPRLTAVLHDEVLAVVEGGNARRDTFNGVVSAVEAMVTAAKRAHEPITFGRPAALLG